MDLLTVERYDFKSDWTIGRFLFNDVKDGFVLEDTVRPDGTKIHGRTAIPFGRYLLGVRQSPKFSKQYLWSDTHQILVRPSELSQFPNISDFREHDLIWLLNVPNFQFILIHWGNTSMGCGCRCRERAVSFDKTVSGIAGSGCYVAARNEATEHYNERCKRLERCSACY